jgi:hypothetical protein
MTVRGSVRPGDLTALQARLGMVVASLFLLFGLVLAAVVLPDLPSSETGLKVALGAFMLIWVAACGAILVSLARVRAAAQGAAPGSLLELQSDGPGQDLDTRLRKLEGLRRDGLLSEAEFQEQRRRALADG